MIHRILSAADAWIMRRVLEMTGDAAVRLTLAGRFEISSSPQPQTTITVRDRATLWHMLFNPEDAFGDAYSDGRLAVDGDLPHLLESIYRCVPDVPGSPRTARFVSWMRYLYQANSRRAARRHIYSHYDLGTDFYQLWLDRRLLYTCAYFPTHDASLEDAQVAKMDHICRKLRLQPGEEVVDAGCGWGGFALHMARRCGVRVRAFNLSHDQILYARARAAAAGSMAGSVEFIEDDYRNMSGRADAFVSVGMLEHVGPAHYTEMGALLRRVLGNSGRGLLHFIGRVRPSRLSPWISKRVFPGAYAPALSEAARTLEPGEFAVLDVENLRAHYALTLSHWRQRYERAFDVVVERFGSEFARAWRLYLAGSEAAFHAGTLQLFQVLFAGRACAGLPWTREYLYAGLPRTESSASWTPATS